MFDMMTDIAGAGLQAAGAEFQGQSNANIANYNATVATQSAAEVTAQGQAEAVRSLQNSRKMISGGQAAFGASGVSGSSVSTQDTLRAGAAQGELNALTIQNNAAIKATAYGNEATLDQYRAQNDITAGNLGAASAIIKGIGGLAGGGGGGGGGSSDMEDIVG
jgi:hypothetical protein